MRVFELDSAAEQRQRIADELRQLKLMSKGLRTKSLRALMQRYAAQRLDAKRVARPAKAPPPPAVAA
jgi:hypothetical protein